MPAVIGILAGILLVAIIVVGIAVAMRKREQSGVPPQQGYAAQPPHSQLPGSPGPDPVPGAGMPQAPHATHSPWHDGPMGEAAMSEPTMGDRSMGDRSMSDGSIGAAPMGAGPLGAQGQPGQQDFHGQPEPPFGGAPAQPWPAGGGHHPAPGGDFGPGEAQEAQGPAMGGWQQPMHGPADGEPSDRPGMNSRTGSTRVSARAPEPTVNDEFDGTRIIRRVTADAPAADEAPPASSEEAPAAESSDAAPPADAGTADVSAVELTKPADAGTADVSAVELTKPADAGTAGAAPIELTKPGDDASPDATPAPEANPVDPTQDRPAAVSADDVVLPDAVDESPVSPEPEAPAPTLPTSEPSPAATADRWGAPDPTLAAAGATSASSTTDADAAPAPAPTEPEPQPDRGNTAPVADSQDRAESPAVTLSPDEQADAAGGLGFGGSDQPAPQESPRVGERRLVSTLEEVVDGGYGVGSAAPVFDGAQPLGHPVKGVKGEQRYWVPGAPWYDEVTPDVWFYDEAAAQRCGFHGG